MITQKLIEEIYKVATGETEIGHDDTDALAWISSRCAEELGDFLKPISINETIADGTGRMKESDCATLTFTDADASSALALLTEPEKLMVADIYGLFCLDSIPMLEVLKVGEYWESKRSIDWINQHLSTPMTRQYSAILVTSGETCHVFVVSSVREIHPNY